MRVIEARYEKGLLKPREPLALRAGETVGLIIVRRPDPTRWDLERLSKTTTTEETALAQQGIDDWAAALDKEDSR
jgi:predicted DNA-binding antitoxin AbrB/MazE fold protein